MFAGICGKRVGFEEIHCSSSAKRSRCSNFGSPTRSDDPVSFLLQRFPGLSPELVETVFKGHNNNIEDAIESLRTLSFGHDAKQGLDSIVFGDCNAFPGHNGATYSQMAEQRFEDIKDSKSPNAFGVISDGSKWVDLFVNEMMNATDLNNARLRGARILGSFEQNITSRSRASQEMEHVSLKEHLHSLLNDNQILKKAIAIQHERNLENDEKTRESQQLKHALSQYQEQVRNLELSNYTLKLHLQMAQESSSGFGKFHPDIY